MIKQSSFAQQAGGMLADLWPGIALIACGSALALRAGCKKGQFNCREPEGAGLEDGVDEASWESFPASDPPSHSPGN